MNPPNHKSNPATGTGTRKKSTSKGIKRAKQAPATILQSDVARVAASVAKAVSAEIGASLESALSRPIQLAPLQVSLIPREHEKNIVVEHEGEGRDDLIVGTMSQDTTDYLEVEPSQVNKTKEKHGGLNMEKKAEDPGLPDPVQAILRVMGRKRRKWRPPGIYHELKSLYPSTTLTLDDVAGVVDRLAKRAGKVPPDMHAVKLSTRYIRGDRFSVLDEIKYLDLVILAILASCEFGMPATLIHAALDMVNLVKVSQPTLLNHLRMLRSAGWNLLEKAEPTKRANYLLTSKGKAFLARTKHQIATIDDQQDWIIDNFTRLGLLDETGTDITPRVIILLRDFKGIVEKTGSAEHQVLLMMYEAKQLDDAMREQHGRALRVLRHAMPLEP
ncbi:hypothetical protein GF325_06585 [Candidatus Bathyarchaeota archaeon]|nr:hypothetical protein [Candidatus Bathyarchaeota archaeon]